MDRYTVSSDGVRIHSRLEGAGPTALVFVHGWLGNAEWWSAQRDHFADRYTVVRIDLAGHGRSESSRARWSARQYADDIKSVTDQTDARAFVLVGHSMSGAYALEASRSIPRTRAVVLVDTLKDLDQLMSRAQTDQLLDLYRSDFEAAVRDVLPARFFSSATPPEVRARIQRELLQTPASLAIRAIEPLYAMDVRETARHVTVPVRAINGDFTPTNRLANARYFRDYDVVTVADAAHYPMLERPGDFNRLLDDLLTQLTR